MKLSELLKQDPSAQQYFDTLPVYVQETMMQIGQDYNTVEDLRHRGEWMTKYKGLPS